MPLSLAQVGDNITKHYLEARYALIQVTEDLIDPVHALLTQLDITCTPPVYPEPLTFIDYPQSFYPQTSQQESSFRLLKERIQTLKNVKPLLNSVHSSLANNTNQRLIVAQETEKRAQKQLQLVNAEKLRLDELNTQLTSRQAQLKDYEQQVMKQQQKVQMEIQIAGAKFKQKLLEEVNLIKQEKLNYEQEFAMQKAQREQELLDLQSQLNQTKKELSDLSMQKDEVQLRQTLQQVTQNEYMQIQRQASQNIIQEQERLDFLHNNVVDDSILVENDTQTLTGQCIQLFKNKDCLTDQGSEQVSSIQKCDVQSPQSHLSQADRREVMPAQQEAMAPNVQMLQKLAPPVGPGTGYTIPAQWKTTNDTVPVAEWAQGELLERCVLATYGINPGQYFKNKGKTSVYELFGIGNHPYDMKNRQTQVWSKDKLGARDQECYNKSIGWLAE